LFLELLSQLNRSLGCTRGSDNCVSLEGLQFLSKKIALGMVCSFGPIVVCH